MKRGILLLALWCLTAAAENPDGGKLQEICNRDRFAKACLAGLLTFRCGQYHTELHALGTCLDGSRDAANLIDLAPTTRDASVQAVAFSSELVKLMKDPFTVGYLETTKEAIGEAMQHHAPFDLWKHTLKFLKDDKSKALWFLGVLAQDTSSAVEHVEYLRDRKPPGVSASSVQSLSDLMDLLEPEQLSNEDYKSWLKLYPAMVPVGAEASFHPSVYHFYSLGYLSLRLKWRNANQKLAAFLPFWIEVAYKFRGISPERWPLDPKPFDEKKFESQLQDIYTSYVATRWAAGLPAPKITRSEFTKRLAKNPSGFLKELYLNLL